jgi:Cohesin domain
MTKRNLLKTWAALACLGVGLAGALRADAATITLSPATSAPSVGSTFSLDVVVSGLETASASSLGAFDLNVAYDPSKLTFSGATFGPLLGTLPGEAFADVLPSAGSINLAEVSLLSPAALDGLQPASFTVATLQFVATSATPSTVSVSSGLLSDAFARPIGIDSLGSATVSPTSAVPEPGAFLLYGAGLLVVARSRRFRRRIA